MDNFAAQIRAAVNQWEPKMRPGELDHDAAAVCMGLTIVDGSSNNEQKQRRAFAEALEIDGSRCIEILDRLQAGKVLYGMQYAPKIADRLRGVNSGVVLAILVNVAQGFAAYNPSSDAFRLTKAGCEHVEGLIP